MLSLNLLCLAEVRRIVTSFLLASGFSGLQQTDNINAFIIK
jgi:hypothetical protein